VLVAVGTQDLGHRHADYTRAIVAEELGLQINDVVEQIGIQSWALPTRLEARPRQLVYSPSVKDAAIKTRLALAEKIAPLFGNAKVEEIAFAGGNVTGGGKSLSWKQACAALPAAGVTSARRMASGSAGRGVHGVCFAEVEVDVETGKVRPVKMVQVQDGGLHSNRLTMESQLNGGMIQSLGMASGKAA